MMRMLLCVLASAICTEASSQDSAPQPPAPIVGAIRWDGWFDGNPWEKNLAPPQWRYRLPFFATVSEDGKVRVCEDAQDVMDREIAYAKDGGVAYWAFCYYHPKSWPQADAYNYGWRRYLASDHKHGLNFCLLLQGGQHLGPPAEWDATVAQFVTLFKEPTYQRVRGGRPLVYVFSCENLIPHFGSKEAAGDAFRRLRDASKAANAGDPYIVAQIWLHQTHADFLDAAGFDALGAYSAHANSGSGEPFARLTEMNRHYWETYKSTKREVVPLVNAGWDGRPRNYPGNWYEPAKPEEVAGAVRSAFDWIVQNPNAAPARTVLVYAWNEFDEGGWLCPTREEGPARLNAIKTMRDTYPR